MRAPLWLVTALLLTGCASAHVLPIQRVTGDTPCLQSMPERDLLFGVALSGGGTRAALFGAAGLEALAGLRTADGASVIQKINHVSSVSGGSLAASYYTLKKPGHAVPVLEPDGTMSEAYRTFFAQYRADLSHDIENALIRRQLLSFRWLNPALAARTLAEILRERLFGDATLGDISRREANGDSPGLIVNTTLYNNGRRLALTTLPPEAFQYDFFADLRRTLAERGREPEPAPFIETRWKQLLPMTPLDIHLDPCSLRVIGAATASASFPPLVGPLTFQVAGEKVYWHAGDGGLYENQGIESLLFLYLKQLQLKRTKRAFVLAFDSSFPFSVGERRLGLRSLPFTILTFDFSRIPSIMEERATTYQALFFRSLQLEGVFPDAKTIQVLMLRHTDAKWAPDLSDLPASCKEETEPLTTLQAVTERIAEIPTRLVLPNPCDRDLLAAAGAKLVAEHRDTIINFLNGGAGK